MEKNNFKVQKINAETYPEKLILLSKMKKHDTICL